MACGFDYSAGVFRSVSHRHRASVFPNRKASSARRVVCIGYPVVPGEPVSHHDHQKENVVQSADCRDITSAQLKREALRSVAWERATLPTGPVGQYVVNV